MIQAITGPNFSGKTFYMQCYSSFPADTVMGAAKNTVNLFRDSRNDLYLGAIPDYFLTGIFNNVKAEITRYSKSNFFEHQFIKEFSAKIELPKLYLRNPFTLSGGEKAIVSTLSFMSSNPRSLSIDNTLEQIDLETKIAMLECLSKTSIPEIFLTDNRIEELPCNLVAKTAHEKIEHTQQFDVPIQNIQSDLFIANDKFEKQTFKISDLTFGYRDTKLFNKLSLQFESGNVYQLRGKTGTGKSTLSKILCGALKPERGTFYYNENKVNPYSCPGAFFGYTFQQPDDQLFSQTVSLEVGIKSAQRERSNAFNFSILESFGLQPFSNFHPFDLPVSMRKRLSMAAALAVDRPFYIFDEPTLYLDDHNVAQLKKIIDALTCAGKGVIIISHSKAFIESFDLIKPIDL